MLEAKQRESKNPVLAQLLESAGHLRLSRRMDLWSFLDAPRRRLQRYPMLLRAVVKCVIAKRMASVRITRVFASHPSPRLAPPRPR